MADLFSRIILAFETRGAQALAAIKGQFADVESSAGKLNTALGAIGAGAVFAGFAASVQGILAYRSALDDLADTTGDSVTTLDGLARVARVSGTDVSELGGILSRLSKSLGDAGEDGKAAATALGLIGLSVEQLRTLKPAEAFLEVAKALGEFEDGQDKVRVAQALFGKQGAAILPLLKDMAEEGKLAGRVTAEQAAQAEKLEKEWRRLNLAFRDGKDALVDSLVPAIDAIATAMRKAAQEGGLLKAAIAGIQTALTGNDRFKSDKELSELVDKKLVLERQIAEARDETRAFRGIPAKKLEADLAEVEAQIRRVQTFRQQLDSEEKGASDQPKKPLVATKLAGDKPEAGGAKLSEFDQLRQSLEQELARAGAAGSKEEELRLALATDKYKQLTAAQREQIVELGRLIDTRKVDQLVAELNAKDEKKSIEEQIALLKKKNDELRASADEFAVLADPTIPIQQRLARLGEVQKSDRALDPEQADIAYFKLQQELLRVQTGVQGVNEELERGDDIARDLGLTFTSAFEDAIAGGKGLSEVLKGLAADVGKIITRKTITEPLGEGISGLIKDSGVGKGIGSFFKDLFRADGGPVSAGSPYIVGERGPELFVPGASGHIVPNGGFGGDTYVIDARGADAGGLARLESMIRSLNGSIERRSVAAVFNAQMRGVRV